MGSVSKPNKRLQTYTTTTTTTTVIIFICLFKYASVCACMRVMYTRAISTKRPPRIERRRSVLQNYTSPRRPSHVHRSRVRLNDSRIILRKGPYGFGSCPWRAAACGAAQRRGVSLRRPVGQFFRVWCVLVFRADLRARLACTWRGRLRGLGQPTHRTAGAFTITQQQQQQRREWCAQKNMFVYFHIVCKQASKLASNQHCVVCDSHDLAGVAWRGAQLRASPLSYIG